MFRTIKLNNIDRLYLSDEKIAIEHQKNKKQNKIKKEFQQNVKKNKKKESIKNTQVTIC